MADVTNLVQSKYLNGEEVGDQPKIVTIQLAGVEEFDDGQKVVVYYREIQKPHVLNKTGLRKLYGLYGPETEAWRGQKVQIYGEQLTSGKFSGKWTVCITRPPQLPLPQLGQPEQHASQPVQNEEVPF
ncbi:MAG: hypothetical protein JXM69_06330 [Anaerolineae bacterium]|nr:hypothetical protein [Anaerolineae bacterium]